MVVVKQTSLSVTGAKETGAPNAHLSQKQEHPKPIMFVVHFVALVTAWQEAVNTVTDMGFQRVEEKTAKEP